MWPGIRASTRCAVLRLRCQLSRQIFASTSLGAVHVLYSPTDSERGATLAMQRTARRLNDDGGVPNQAAILTPEALPMFADPDALKGAKKRKRTAEEHAVFKAYKPLPPLKGLGKGGRLGTSQNSHEVKALVRDTLREEDVRAVRGRPGS